MRVYTALSVPSGSSTSTPCDGLIVSHRFIPEREIVHASIYNYYVFFFETRVREDRLPLTACAGFECSKNDISHPLTGQHIAAHHSCTLRRV